MEPAASSPSSPAAATSSPALVSPTATSSAGRAPDPFPEFDDEKRRKLIQEIKKALEDPEETGKLTPMFVDPGKNACFWLAEYEYLERWFAKYIRGQQFYEAEVHVQPDARLMKSLRIWLTKEVQGQDTRKRKFSDGSQRSSSPTEIPRLARSADNVPLAIPSTPTSVLTPLTSPTPSTPLTAPAPSTLSRPKPKAYSHSNPVANACRERDQDKCVITKWDLDNQVAHIYPHSLGNAIGKREWDSFWNPLRIFWSPAQIDQWENEVLGNMRTEIPPNLLCLAPHVKTLWDKARFGLKPIGPKEDGHALEVEFHWLPMQMDRRIFVRIGEVPPKARPSTIKAKFRNIETDEDIESGDRLLLRTPDPQRWPLPSMKLLSMRWTLDRLCALAGAAKEYDDDDQDHDDPMVEHVGSLWEEDEEGWNYTEEDYTS
ncbi:HNH endonuclease signature motif containing protein [Aspergillus mulundensis]|uniref:HNH nuclease domain-containing protein n=1 Tax=Aspergillus mulundensis TaxID=1810919 RepID=A0A3D8S573_9EURO|nr:hypothetical protein DSM5745_04985 [Aspergillus mulundensis]RDW81428.1 hypothetical protein DSM5745_04985 [Aspergillus mulundensis]